MRFTSLEALRKHEIAVLTRTGAQVIAHDWGLAPMTRDDLAALAESLHGQAGTSLREALASGLDGELNLWAFVQRGHSRRLVLFRVARYGDEHEVRQILSETDAPPAMDVPPSCWNETRPTDVGANPGWRAEVARHRRYS